MHQDWINALLGGGIIGLAVSIMLLFNGRVTGISGIVSGMLNSVKGDTLWRILFVLGLLTGGLVTKRFTPTAFEGQLSTDNWTVLVAGLLVGFGTLLGSGCTSGHGVCGLSRLSIRSIISTITFICAGVCAVAIFRIWGLLP